MTFFEILNTLLIGPIKLIFEVVFSLANSALNNPGLSLICLSLTINLLVLPLYMRADAMQKQAQEKERRLHDGIAHIKKTFSGDERMMILQTYYRQNNYSPFSALGGSVSLLLQIPFFMAAVQVISNIPLLSGASLGPISDLGAPDGLLKIAGYSFNLLPVLMTLINFVSSALFSRGHSLKSKIQLYALAVFFLIFLYNYPSGLVFYWLLNNVFSFVKTVVYKIVGKLRRKADRSVQKANRLYSPNRRLFLLSCGFSAVLTGLLIPSALIASSPQEFFTINTSLNPIWYIISAACYSAGIFLVWMQVFYWLANSKVKCIFEKAACAFGAIAIVGYMFFDISAGDISTSLHFNSGNPHFTAEQLILNFTVLVFIGLILYITARKKAVVYVLLAASIAITGMSGVNIFKTQKAVTQTQEYKQDNGTPEFTLSKNGKNVVVLMLDRACSIYVPYIMDERPQLKEQFSGFTNYTNTISYGSHTNIAVPALLGGYEYTPVEMNKRAGESLAQKHNEAHMVMPRIFSENNFKTTVSDPVYIDYNWVSDLAFFDDYPEITATKTIGKFTQGLESEAVSNSNLRNVFCYSFMQTAPLALRGLVYDEGNYNRAVTASSKADPQQGGLNYAGQTIYDNQHATGIKQEFAKAYNVLKNLPEITNVTNSDENTFLFMMNTTTHEQTLLQLPDYTMSEQVDNSGYPKAYYEERTLPGYGTLRLSSTEQITHYHVNMAAFIQIGQWLDYLKEEGAYDNTRIIIVSDHGYPLRQSDDLILNSNGSSIDLQFYAPLLMVKDFGAEEFSMSDEFMTNADVVTLATQGIIENPVNPFTGKAINSKEKYAHEQFVSVMVDWSNDYKVEVNNGNQYLPSKWISVKNNLWNSNSWTVYDSISSLSKHTAP